MLQLWPPDEPVLFASHGLVLREWAPADVPAMVGLFDTAQMNRTTPLTSPFDRTAAADYIEAAHRHRRELGTLQLAITERGSQPEGEVIVFATDEPSTVELAFAVGAKHAGRGLAATAVRAILTLATRRGVNHARLTIALDNIPSQRVARATGFALTSEPLIRRERKGQVLQMQRWRRPLAGGGHMRRRPAAPPRG